MSSIRTLLTSVALLSTTGWAQYVLEDDFFSGGNFFDKFSFFTDPDPTHGFVKYVDRDTAYGSGLVNNNNGQVYMGVDHTNNAPNGRNAVRITSNKAYNSGLIILDAAKMPGSICGAWPAFWMVGPNWPNGGEIDIIEGVNEQDANDMTLHTADGCSISGDSSMVGLVNTRNCFINAPGQGNNQGCQITTGNTQTYGTGFNNNGGGVYATEWTSEAIKIFFFPRNAIPADITSGKPNPSSWGSPLAHFKGDCRIPDHFKNLQIVFNIAMCGDWAGNVWGSSACAAKASSCSAFVANNPSAFKDAFWLINSLKVYQAGASALSSPAPAPAPSSWSAAVASSPATASPAAPSPSPVSLVAPSPAPAQPDTASSSPASQESSASSSSNRVTSNATVPRRKKGKGKPAQARDLEEELRLAFGESII